MPCVVGGELHHEQVSIVGVSVPAQDCVMRDAIAFGPGDPGIEVGVEVVDPTGSELDDLRELHDALASSTMLNGVSATRRSVVNPAPVTISRSRASPACAPSAVPTSWDSELGVQSRVENP